MTSVTPAQIAAAEAAARPYMADGVCIAAAALEIVNAFLDSAPIRKSRQKAQDEPEGFSQFYTTYPRKEARRDAAKAYSEALVRGSSVDILAGATRYALAIRGQDPKFTKLPATWLRADCWKDEPNKLFSVVQGGQSFVNCSDAQWLTRLEIFMGKTKQPQKTWHPTWGPPPTDKDCKAPETARKLYRQRYPKTA